MATASCRPAHMGAPGQQHMACPRRQQWRPATQQHMLSIVERTPANPFLLSTTPATRDRAPLRFQLSMAQPPAFFPTPRAKETPVPCPDSCSLFSLGQTPLACIAFRLLLPQPSWCYCCTFKARPLPPPRGPSHVSLPSARMVFHLMLASFFATLFSTRTAPGRVLHSACHCTPE